MCFIITIDGSGGSGKTTLARNLAMVLDGELFSTGKLYRMVALIAAQQKRDTKDENYTANLASYIVGEMRQRLKNEDWTPVSGCYISYEILIYDGRTNSNVKVNVQTSLEDSKLNTDVVSQNTLDIITQDKVRNLIDTFVIDYVKEARHRGRTVILDGRRKTFALVSPDLSVSVRCDPYIRAIRQKMNNSDYHLKISEIMRNIERRDQVDEAVGSVGYGMMLIDSGETTMEKMIAEILTKIRINQSKSLQTS